MEAFKALLESLELVHKTRSSFLIKKRFDFSLCLYYPSCDFKEFEGRWNEKNFCDTIVITFDYIYWYFFYEKRRRF